MLAIIKGDRFVAAGEAARRGIPAVFVRECLRFSTAETVIRFSPEHESEVRAWFHEDGNKPAPFPPGACLWFGR